jgi:PAS domain-containing protein
MPPVARAQQHAYLPIIHLTATFVANDDLMQGLSAGGDSYLTHPVDPPVLIATVRALLFARQADVLKRTTDARFRTIFELASSGIAMLDTELTFQDVNPEFCRARRPPPRRHHRQEMRRRHRARHEELCRQLHASLTMAGAGKARCRWRDRTAASPKSNGASSPRTTKGARIAIATNVTEREKLLESERAARTEAERSNRLKDEFLADAVARVAQSAECMLGWASVLKRKNVTPAMLEQGLDAIERNSRVQSHLIEDPARLRRHPLRQDAHRRSTSIPPGRAPVESAARVVLDPGQQQGRELHLHVSDREAHVLAD